MTNTDMTLEQKEAHYEYYETPKSLINAYLDTFVMRYDSSPNSKPIKRILEIGGGTGSISSCLVDYFPDAEIDIIEIMHEREEVLSQYGNPIITDFFEWRPENRTDYDLVIYNPSFKCAMRTTLRALRVTSDCPVVMLAPVHFGVSLKRKLFLNDSPPDSIAFCSSRQTFKSSHNTVKLDVAFWGWRMPKTFGIYSF